MHNGPNKLWGQIVNPHVNKNRAGLGFSLKNGKGENMNLKSALGKYQYIFHNGGYLHPTVPRINAIVEGEAEQEMLNYVAHGVKAIQEIPSFIH